jgi:PAS domain S-box-containing protein
MATTGGAVDPRLLSRLARAMTASLGLGDVLAEASRTAGELLPDSVVLAWVRHGDRLVLRGAAGVLEQTHAGTRLEFDVGDGLVGHVARLRHPLVIEDPARDPRAREPDFLRAERVRWFVGLPLDGRYALEGVLGIFSRAPEPPDAEVVDALGSLAAQAALAVEGARLDARNERRRREAEALAAVSQALSYSLDPSEVSQLIADSVTTLLGARGAAVFRLEPATGNLVSVASGGWTGLDLPLTIPRGVGLVGRAAREGRLRATCDILNDPDLFLPPEVRARLRILGVGAALAAPLLVDGEAIGVLAVGTGVGMIFDDDARRLLETLADQAAVALNNARLFAAERAARETAEAAQQRFRGLVESVDAVVSEFDVASRRVLFVSRRAESLLGYPIETWTTQPAFWLDHLHPDDRARVVDYSAAEAAAGRDHVQEYRMLASDGRVVWVRDSARLVRDGAQPPRLRCLQVDVTERKRTEALLASEKVVLEMIAAGEPLALVLQAVCRAVESQGEETQSAVLLVDGERLRLGAAPSLPGGLAAALDGAAIDPDAGSCGAAASRRQAVVVDDLAREPRWPAERALALRHGLRACWVHPVQDAGGGVLAVFAAFSRHARRPDADDRRLIERAARLAGIAIERVRAEEIRARLLSQVITVQEEERRRIARELHDETAQSLASLLLGLSALQDTRSIKAARDRARALHQITTRALAEVRRLAWGLRPSLLDDLGLTAAVERYTEEFAQTRGLAVDLATSGLEQGRLPAAVETALFRIMQEALSNVARHAGARRVGVRLWRDGGTVRLVVEDDGQGFDPTRPAPPAAARGLGIHSMRERAAAHKGLVAIDSAPGRGTRVAVEIPLTVEAP